jgi:hypothetical protein
MKRDENVSSRQLTVWGDNPPNVWPPLACVCPCLSIFISISTAARLNYSDYHYWLPLKRLRG